MEVDACAPGGVAHGNGPFLAGPAQTAAELRVARVHHQLLARLCVLHGDETGVGQFVFAGVEQPHGDDLVPCGEPGERLLPARLADEVRHEHDQRAALDDSARLLEQAAQVGDAPCGLYRAEQIAEQQEDLVATLPGGDRARHGVVVDEGADAIAVANQHAGDRGGECYAGQ